MIDGVIVKKLDRFNDERGYLAEFWRNDDSGYQAAMGYVSVTLPGVVRGPHEHVYQSDCFVFVGPGKFDLHLWDRREASATKGEYMYLPDLGETAPTAVIVPPGVVHGYKATGEQASWCINLPDKLYKGVNKSEEVDEIRWEIDPESPYKID